jgi:hypothetical protein
MFFLITQVTQNSVHYTCARIVDMVVDWALDLYADDRIPAEYDSVLYRSEP